MSRYSSSPEGVVQTTSIPGHLPWLALGIRTHVSFNTWIACVGAVEGAGLSGSAGRSKDVGRPGIHAAGHTSHLICRINLDAGSQYFVYVYCSIS
ncbi:hypothetical protein OIN60_10950 [Paenibacillus sp. P96]|uniref:Uncharacterized protein n=1 Tax=Paenibacillus zeirhizosphaerae TaxID=2987519 RepID=A0ABT9FRE0_9BACL|nr:hypothetical protein [Paenibacillus sp. P96]MDP4097289.1 hypothetical protein [Paenibacillus sp. P96]